jgi:hypothetical protein
MNGKPDRSKVPTGPLWATAVLLWIGAAYLLMRPGSPMRMLEGFPSPDPAVLRVASWNLEPVGEGAEAQFRQRIAESAAKILGGIEAHVVALQGIPDAETAAEIAGKLGEGWRAVVVPRTPGAGTEHVGFLIQGDLALVERRIVSMGPGVDALAVRTRTPRGLVVHLASFLVAERVAPARQQLEALTAWADHQDGGWLILLGAMATDDSEGRSEFGTALRRFLLKFQAAGIGRESKGHGREFSGGAVFVRANIEPASFKGLRMTAPRRSLFRFGPVVADLPIP